MKKYKHWIKFSIFNIEKVNQFLNEGSNFVVLNIYTYPSEMGVYVLEIESTDNYDNLDLSVNDGWGILKHFKRKPILEKPITNKFMQVYGNLPKIV
ncbi:TPA: hypothetical protein PTV45_000557 [Clostridium botulinum]|nr:hypothetical protein [Clostridium botulinum]